MAEQHGRARRSYAGTVLVGLATAALAAVAGSRSWATGHASAGGLHVHASATGSQAAPLVSALALVALAGWGVVLVTRRAARRAVAVVGLLAGVGAAVAAVLGRSQAGDHVTRSLLAQGAGTGPLTGDTNGWPVVAVVTGLVTAGAFMVAVLEAPTWPEMGSKYDAPAARADGGGPAPEGDAHGPDMWRALDEGHDPTS